MIRSLVGIFAVAWGLGGFAPALISQETNQESAGELPRLTPEERREQWEQMRQLSPEERRARLAELRARRGGEVAETVPEIQPPESYLDQLEFRGIQSLDGVIEFSLYNPYEERTILLSADQGRNGLEVVGFDREQDALTLEHEGETRTVYLQRARVAELSEAESRPDAERDERRERWERRRERFREFRQTWEEAAKSSPELRQIEQQFGELVGDFRENRSALRDAPEGSPEREELQEQERAMREEFRLLSEFSVMEMKKNPAFQAEDVDSMEGMLRGLMFRAGREDGDRRRGREDRRSRETGPSDVGERPETRS